ncbi:MAG: hypothetical protein JWN04_2439, partial [Myxococcaceae bacterium]|nr:hypothetical protein [Myxococcaceae bacterium]
RVLKIGEVQLIDSVDARSYDLRELFEKSG